MAGRSESDPGPERQRRKHREQTSGPTDGVADCRLWRRADRVGIEDHDIGARVARVLGVRDVLSGLAMIVAPPGPALAVAVAARVASDLSDAASFQGLAPDAQARRKVALAAIGWATACAITGVVALRGAQH